MEHITKFARDLWDKGERDYQRAARLFLYDVLESGDPFKYLWTPVSDRMGNEFRQFRKARLDSLPPPIPPASEGAPPVITDLPSTPARSEIENTPAVQHSDESQTTHGGRDVGVETASTAHGPDESHFWHGGAGSLPVSEDIPGHCAHTGDDSHMPYGTIPGEQDLTGCSVQTMNDGPTSDGAAPGEQDTAEPAVTAQEVEPVPSPLPAVRTPLEQRIAHLEEKVFIAGQGMVKWQDVTLDGAVATIQRTRQVISGLMPNLTRLERAVSQMERHHVQAIGDLPAVATALIFREMAA